MLLLAAVCAARWAAPHVQRAAPQAAGWLAGAAKRAVGLWATSRAVLIVSATAAQATAACPPLLAGAAVQGAAACTRAWLARRCPARGKTCTAGGGSRALCLLVAAASPLQPHRLPADQVSELAVRGAVGALFYGQVLGSLAALAGIRLLCRRDRLPWTGRTALLPRRWVEAVFNNTLGLALHFAYPVLAVAKDLGSPLGIFAALRFNRSLRTLGAHNESVRCDHAVLHTTAMLAAEAKGRPLAPSLVVSSSVLPVTTFNAVSIPGGSVYLHSGLIEGVGGNQTAVRFVTAHEVGHALARHGAQRLVRLLMQPLVISAAVGAATMAAMAIREVWVSHGRSKDDAARQRRPWPFRWLPPRRVHQRQAERRTERLVQRVNVGSQLALNALAFLASLADSRRNEYEADLLALCLMRAAGMCGGMEGARRLFSIQHFSLPAFLSFLSTHPTKAQRLRALEQAAAAGLPRA